MSDAQKMQKPRGVSLSKAGNIARLRALRNKNITATNETAVPVPAYEIGTVMEDGMVYAGISPDTNKAMYVMPADEFLKMNFNEAAAHAEHISQLSGKPYRLPSEAELDVLFNNRAAIGGFNADGPNNHHPCWHWSSSAGGIDSLARVRRFDNGGRSSDTKVHEISVRLVRN